jgi:hypothetical protein
VRAAHGVLNDREQVLRLNARNPADISAGGAKRLLWPEISRQRLRAQQPPARILARKKMENHDDWTENAGRGGLAVDNPGNIGTRAAGDGFSGGVSKSRSAEWRCADSRGPSGPGATRRRCRQLSGQQCVCGDGQRWSLSPRPALTPQWTPSSAMMVAARWRYSVFERSGCRLASRKRVKTKGDYALDNTDRSCTIRLWQASIIKSPAAKIHKVI